jgi:hypothetical protein
MIRKFQLVWLMHMRITIVVVKLVFSSCRKFQNGTKSSEYVLCKIKETATERIEMLKSAYSEECVSRTSVFERQKRFEDGLDSLQDERKDHC